MKEYKDLVELVKKVQSESGHILATDEASICEYQDMIGHSSVEDLAELANGVYKETFYRVYGMAYGTIEAIRFHCQHGEKILEICRRNDELQADVEDLTDTLKRKDEQIARKQETAEKFQQGYEKALADIKAAEERAAKAEAENIALKAKLYDLMTAGE